MTSSSSSSQAVLSEQLAEGRPARSTELPQPEMVEQVKEKPDLPPFNILVKWLSYYHAETGTWPEPDDSKATFSTKNIPLKPEDKPRLTILSGKPKAKRANRVTAAEQKRALDSSGSNNYDFQSSIYHSTALALVEAYERGHDHRHELEARPLSEASILTLASVLAWCHYPPFLTRYKEADPGLGMYLPLAQWSKSLRMRKATLGTSLKELAEAGLIKTGQPSVKEITNKKLTRLYRLAVPLEQPLPLFDPSENRVTFEVGAESRVEGYQPDLAIIATNPKAEPHPGAPEPAYTPAPGPGTIEAADPLSMTHDRSYKNKKLNLIKNHDHASSAESGTSQEKLEFLSQKASFPGFTSPEGLSALDSREALKFAVNPALDLSTIQKIYHHVLSAWSTGKCTKNPIGFFHYTLTRYLNQKPSEPEPESNKQPKSSTAFSSSPEPEPQFKTGKKFKVKGSSRFPSTTVLAENEQAELASQPITAFNQDTQLADELVDINKIQGKLKEQVVEALHDRFKQPALASTLSQLDWLVSLTDSKIEVRLEKQGSAFLAASTLGQGDFSLVKMAASQTLKVLTGKVWEIDVFTL